MELFMNVVITSMINKSGDIVRLSYDGRNRIISISINNQTQPQSTITVKQNTEGFRLAIFMYYKGDKVEIVGYLNI